MQKVETQQANVRNQPTKKKSGAAAVKQMQTGKAVQLKAMIESSRKMDQLSNLTAIIESSPRQVAAQRTTDMIRNSPRQQAAQKFSDDINNSPMEVAQRFADEEPLQGKFTSQAATQLKDEAAAKTNNTGLPDTLKSGIESLSGMSMDNVRVHYNSSRPAQLNAHAYAQGTTIHVAPGQEQHLPHEAWHVVQQAQGRVMSTRQMKGGVALNDDAGLEREADVMGNRAWDVPSRDERWRAGSPEGEHLGPAGNALTVQQSAGPLQMKLKSAEADQLLQDIQPIYARMRPLLRVQNSTWSGILNCIDVMLEYRPKINRDGEMEKRILTPEKLDNLALKADACLQLANKWQAEHKSPLFIGKDRWSEKNNALNELTPLLEQLSPSSGGELVLPAAPTRAGDAAVSQAPQASQSGLLVAFAAEKQVFFKTFQSLGYEARLLAGKRKVREAVETSASKYLLFYAEALGEVRAAIIDDRAREILPDPGIVAAIEKHKTDLFEVCKNIPWQWSIPEHSEYVNRDEARQHSLRIVRIRELFRDFTEAVTPAKKSESAEAGDIEAITGGPLDWVFG